MKNILALIASVAAACLLAACSASSPSSGSAPTPNPAATAGGGSASGLSSATDDVDSHASADGPTDAPAAVGSAIPGTDLHVPAVMDCSGSNTAKEPNGDLICENDVANPGAAYNFFLKEIPRAGFHFGSDSWLANPGESVSGQIYFGNATYNGICAVEIIGHDVTVQLNKS